MNSDFGVYFGGQIRKSKKLLFNATCDVSNERTRYYEYTTIFC